MTMDMMGKANQHWGVCGFTSSFYALHELDPKRPKLINASRAFTVLAEIKTYLMMLKAAGKVAASKEIEDFTRTFGKDFSSFTVDNYIQTINDAVDKSDAQIMGNIKHSIAMPPEWVADYLNRIWKYTANVKTADEGGDGIIGVTSGKMKMYDGLEHYMYRNKANIYSWGSRFDSVEAAAKGGAGGANWKVCRFIEIKP